MFLYVKKSGSLFRRNRILKIDYSLVPLQAI